MRSYLKRRFEVKVDGSVGYRVEDGIATVTMQRPRQLNALDGELLGGLAPPLPRARPPPGGSRASPSAGRTAPSPPAPPSGWSARASRPEPTERSPLFSTPQSG